MTPRVALAVLLLLLGACRHTAPLEVQLLIDNASPSYYAGDTLTLSVLSAEPLTRARFYRNGTLLQERHRAPFSASWVAVAGTHQLSAHVVTRRGAAQAALELTVLAERPAEPDTPTPPRPPDDDEQDNPDNPDDGDNDDGTPDENDPGDDGTSTPTEPGDEPSDTRIPLPIEILGADGYSESVTFELHDASGITALYLQCHRCGYRDSSVNPARGTKGSVRLNGGDWLPLDDYTATVQEPEQSYGGIAGSFHTVRFTVPISGAVVGENRLEFRFNGTDGFSHGYRIIDFNLRRGETNVLPRSAFRHDDPSSWQPPLSNPADVAEGRRLWERGVLQESPLSNRQLRASCASCHAADGRDLKYFNYSNWSIIARSMFHGLSETEGKQIAAYIRSLPTPAPAQARPWNPPYQPGPGLDSEPVEAWAAGAGLAAVLEHDREMLPYLFPEGTSETAIARVIDIKGTLNIRELPIPLQLPDWNAWLPEVHPLDLWGDAYAASDAARAYTAFKTRLQGYASAMVQDGSIITALEGWMRRSWEAVFATYMHGPNPCRKYREAVAQGNARPSLMDQLPPGKTCEDGLKSLNHLLAVKNWEIFQSYRLEDVTPHLYPYGEPRGWFGKERNVFEVAAHRSADYHSNFRHQSRAMGAYHSAAWYHLQMILNAGNRDPWTWFPQDWFYTPQFIALTSRENRQPLALLNAAMHIKMYQNLDMTGPDGLGVDRGPGRDGWWLPFVTPWRFESTMGWEGRANWRNSIAPDETSRGFPWIFLDSYEPGLRLKITEALLRQFLDKMTSYPIAALPRQTDPSKPGGDRFEHPNYLVPTDIPPATAHCYYSCPGEGYQARDIYRALYRFREMGVDAHLRAALIDYMKQLFPHPQNDWDALR